MASEVNSELLAKLKKKAKKSYCRYKISAIALDKKGDVLGSVTNCPSRWNVIEKEDGEGRAGTGIHAERRLIAKYGKNIKSIVICRVGHGGDLREIEPCHACKKAADKLGIKIMTVK